MRDEMTIQDSLTDWSSSLDRLLKHLKQNIINTQQQLIQGLKDILGTNPIVTDDDFFISQDDLDSLVQGDVAPQ
ncbi:MAG: hypothetical protein HQK75_11860 [Candidatus Magnetomorum sp.]|nr:hypothetical protein [Candidatus Magnetomorum sp.]